MALDTGRLSETPSLAEGAHVGEALQRLRLHLGLSLEDVAEATRVRRSYLAAIEEMRLEALPARPFTIGYIRAFAQALGGSADTAVERFRAEQPAREEPLRAPVGLSKGADPRLAAVLIAACLVMGAIVAWNVVQRTVKAPDVQAAPAVAARAPAPSAPNQGGPVALGAPLPPPVEATTPRPYETPGLAQAVTGENGVITLDQAPADLNKAAAEAPPAVAPSHLPATFVADGPIYGAPADARATVILKALKPAPLVVKSHSGAVYFARQLAKGEAYRAPALPGVLVETADPAAFQLFVAGQSRGLLPHTQSELKTLAAPAG